MKIRIRPLSCFLFGVLLAASAGCHDADREPKAVLEQVIGSPAPRQPSRRLILPDLNETAASDVTSKRLSAPAGALVEFRIRSGLSAEELAKWPLYFKVTRMLKNGKPVIAQAGTTTEFTQDPDGTTEHTIQLELPKRPGAYTVGVKFRRQELCAVPLDLTDGTNP